MPRHNERKHLTKEIVKERERQRKVREIEKEHGWESSEAEEGDRSRIAMEECRPAEGRLSFRVWGIRLGASERRRGPRGGW